MKKINLFCGINSVGLPFQRSNKNSVGYYDLVKKHLEEQGNEVGGINISSLTKNRTWNFEEIFKDNYTISNIKNIQSKSVDHLRNSNLFFKVIIPKKWKRDFEVTEEDEKTIFKKMYAESKNAIFLYSAGPNDFFTYIKSGPIELLNSKVRKNMPKNLEELVLKCIDNIDNNLKLLINSNKRAKIYVLGFYYSPLYDKLQGIIHVQEKIKKPNKKYKNRYRNIIEIFNKHLEYLCESYDNVEFVDISFVEKHCTKMDFHPNISGNYLIAKEIIKNIDSESTSK